VTLSTDKNIVFNQPDITDLEIQEVTKVLKSGWLGTGKVSHQFEEEFAGFMGGGYAVAVSSCSIGLQIALEACFRDSEDIIIPALTFAATLNAVINAGLNPILCDVDENGCLDPEKIRINDKIGAIIPVHYSGTPAQMAKIRSKAGKLPIIEDCAHAFGGLLGNYGDVKVFSFYPNKNITCGEGGMLYTKDKDLANKMRVISMQGLSNGAWERYALSGIRNFDVEEVGVKGNLPDVLAAIGLVQLRRWPEMQRRRFRIFSIYEQAFGAMPFGHSHHFYPLRVNNRDELRMKLKERGIGTGIHYKPLHLEPAYDYLGYLKCDFPKAEFWGETELSLPVSSMMTEEDAQRVVDEVKELSKKVT
jgi:dTDP-4-amino-4,6-dideoxygalactose transaminase